MRLAGAARAACALFSAALLACVAGSALAHGAGGSGTIAETGSLPAWVGWAAGGLVVALSFALVGLFLTRDREPQPDEGQPVDPGDVTGLPRGLVGTLRLVGLIALLAVVLAGLVPWEPGPGAERIAWILVWAGLPILAYTLGNVWLLVSPFRALAGLADRMRGRQPRLAYPDDLGAWPSVVLLAGLVLAETAGTGSVWVGRAALVYATFTVVGMAAFGSRTWLAQAEVFDRVFAWWSSVAPGRLRSDGVGWKLPGRELPRRRAAGPADATFLVGLVAATTVDGFSHTSLGRSLLDATGGGGSLVAEALLVLVVFAAFAGLFWGCVAAIRAVTGSPRGLSELGDVFAVTLVPIGVGYHLAHNLPYVVDALPLALGALADPVGLASGVPTAWSIFSSRPALTSALSITAIVLGHVAAVVLAHHRVFTAFESKIQAVKSELPLTGAMIAYTLVSLWIVSATHAGGLVP